MSLDVLEEGRYIVLSGERVFRTEGIVKAPEQKRYCDQGPRDGKSKGQWEVVRGEKSRGWDTIETL